MTRSGFRSRARLGGVVRGHRTAAGLTQRQLAEAAGLSLGAVRDLEQGRTRRPHPASIEQLAAALGLAGRQRDVLFSLEAVAAAAPRDVPAAAQQHRDRPGQDRTSGTGGGGLQLCLLGPLAVWREGLQVTLRTDRQRTVLGLLALHIGIGVHRDVIVDALWGEDPPASAMTIVQSQLSRLRKLLDPDSPGRAGATMLTRAGASYQLPAGTGSDVAEFTKLARRAQEMAAAGDLADACERYERALGLWRGEPLADVDALRSHPEVIELSGQRAAVALSYADVAAAAGWDERVVGHLRALGACDPLNERVHARLMAALAATGQQAAAIGIFEELRRRLHTELGVRPGPELASTHLRILRQKIPAPRNAIGGVPGFRDMSVPEPEPPRQLPPVAPFFVGRHAELTALTGLLDWVGEEPNGAVLIFVISGAAGVGKTALAARWAHRIAARFPDGQLYVNLRGYDAERPLLATDALAGFLRALDVSSQDIPAAAEERAARYRSLLADRRMLVVLDNAGSAEQVRLLLPGAETCAVVVTSRDSLAALVVRDGARRVDLGLLPLGDAVGLLGVLIGGRVDAEPGAAAILAAQCARLPLTLRAAAELAADRPTAPLADLVSDLDDQQRRLDMLDAGGDPRTAVRSVFSWSYRQLGADAARAFRLLGLHPGADLDGYAAAALTGSTAERAAHLLDLLARASLVERTGRGRYGMHHLLRAYAAELAAAQDGEGIRQAALTRLLDHYLHTATTATAAIAPPGRYRWPRTLAAPAPAMRPGPARAWLDAERANLVAVAGYGADHGWPGYASSLAGILWRYLDVGGHRTDAISIHSHARRAAQQMADRVAEADALANLGLVEVRRGRYEQAADHFQQAVALYRHGGDLVDRSGEAKALNGLGEVLLATNRPGAARARHASALDLASRVGDRWQQARAHYGLARSCQAIGDTGQARRYREEALACYIDLGAPEADQVRAELDPHHEQ